MYISKFRVLNYKSYCDSTEVELKRGFNIITGQNSAGKTALLEALDLSFKVAPQRSDKTVPFRGAAPPENSSVSLTFLISGSELVQMIRGTGNVVLPRPNPSNPRLRTGSQYLAGRAGMNLVLEELVQQPELVFSIQLRQSVAQGGDFWANGDGVDFLGFYNVEPPAPKSAAHGFHRRLRGA
jgi:hypothetical protein